MRIFNPIIAVRECLLGNEEAFFQDHREQTDSSIRWPSGWWVLPAVLLGLTFWLIIINAILLAMLPP